MYVLAINKRNVDLYETSRLVHCVIDFRNTDYEKFSLYNNIYSKKKTHIRYMQII